MGASSLRFVELSLQVCLRVWISDAVVGLLRLTALAVDSFRNLLGAPTMLCMLQRDLDCQALLCLCLTRKAHTVLRYRYIVSCTLVSICSLVRARHRSLQSSDEALQPATNLKDPAIHDRIDGRAFDITFNVFKNNHQAKSWIHADLAEHVFSLTTNCHIHQPPTRTCTV